MIISQSQLDRTDRLFFDNCLAHSRRAYELEAPAPAELSRAAAATMLRTARVLYGAINRHSGNWPVPAFPLRDALLACGPDVPPPFWARFDGFVRPDGGIFFAELNLDRPGGHREALSAPITGARFRGRFCHALRQWWQRCAPLTPTPRAAVLVDPAHREELHLAHLYAGLLADLGWPCAVVGPLNLTVAGGQALAFGEPVDLVVRQFPTEFLHEIPAIPALLALMRAGRLRMLNSPSAVAGQAKSSFAWLWRQVLTGSGTLTPPETAAVRAAVPFTASMTAERLPADPANPTGPSLPAPLALLGRPELWVLKPVLGRYSQGVTCGALVDPTWWGSVVAAALAEPAYWVAQRYMPVAQQPLSRWIEGVPTSVNSYVNWGLHFLDGRPAGWIARCSRTPLTDDAWFAPVEIAAKEGTA